MKLGVCSDTHNNLTALENALTLFRQEGIDTVIHCGDLTSPETAAAMSNVRVIHTVGNGDYASGEIRETLMSLNPNNYSGMVWSGELGGVSIAAMHGHVPGVVKEMARSGLYAYVFYGHSHIHREEQVGMARVINPGSLGGLRRDERSVYILDLASGEGRFHILREFARP